MNDQLKRLAVRTLVVTAVVVAVLLFLLLIGSAANVFLIFFVCLLFALFLRGLSHWLSEHSFLSETWALVVVVLGLGIVFGVGSWLLAPSIGKQMATLADELPKSIERLEQHLRQYEWGRRMLGNGSGIEGVFSKIPQAFSKAGVFVSSALGILVNVVVVFFVGIYFAASPHLYINGFLKLLPPKKQPRGREVLFTNGRILQRWLLGRLILMATNGVLTAIGLAVLGVPLAVPLGIIAALLNFIPNLGPILAAIPALLIAFMQGPTIALYVLIFYVAYQMLDGYVFTPLVQKQTIAMPPALTIMAQVLMGVLFGTMGVLVAVPLLAVVLTSIKMLYVEDVLGEPT